VMRLLELDYSGSKNGEDGVGDNGKYSGHE
jgi:hypothetical protein